MDNQDAQTKGTVQQVREGNYNPFSDNVKERDYTRVNAAVSAEEISSPIPEPVYQPQVIGQTRNPYEHISGSDGPRPGSNAGQQKESINPGMNDLPPHERKMAAEQLVDLGLSGYEMIFYFVNKSLQIDKKKLKKLVSEGKVDPNTRIPVSNGYVTVEQFVEEYNEEVADTVGVSNKFKKDIKPPLTRIMEKRGLGATDEQLVVSLLVMHLVQEGTKFAQAMQLKKDLLTIIQERTELEREQGIDPSAYTTPPPPRPKASASPSPEPAPKPKFTAPEPVFTGEEEPDAEDFNFRSNETVMNASVRQMQVPTTGRARLMQQRKKEKIFAENAEKARGGYESAAAKRKTSAGKRGRPKKIVNTKHIAEAVVLKETEPDENALD